ncbi:hypothetical protein [Undibacterium terreum]|uniref:Uncharacterized protein n=1 Tax=Undibacterium terreum TaxID=1224302 RepID=A0A916V179_9BURK|nr:hypothetical protein [Undibacterium terreum]GGC98866.1 hypothetical protein GCM10011396_52990 [Undibacterium terreum]
MVGKDSFAATVVAMLQEKLKTVFVSRAQRKKEADDYAAICLEAWRIARDTAAELREIARQCHLAVENGSFNYDSGKIAAIQDRIAALKAKNCPPELKITISDLEAMIAWTALCEQKMSGPANSARSLTTAEAEEKRSHAEQVEAQLVVNARLATAEADKFVGW